MILVISNKIGKYSEESKNLEFSSFHSVETEANTKGQVETVCNRQQSLGTYIVTAYCSCPKCCGKYADGITVSGHVIQKGDRFCAADPDFPFGTLLEIKEYGTVPVLDRGRVIKGNRIDVYFDTHEEALEWGVKEIEIFCWAYQEQKEEQYCFETTVKDILISITGSFIVLEADNSTNNIYTGMKVKIIDKEHAQKYLTGLIVAYKGKNKILEFRIKYISDALWNPHIGDIVEITFD